MNKLPNSNKNKVFYSVFFIFSMLNTYAQLNNTQNQYGLYVISTKKDFLISINNKPHYAMVDIKQIIPSLIVDLKYATSKNFMHTNLYNTLHTTYLRKNAAEQLKKIQSKLNSMGLGLKIFDAYRPFSVTEKMWKLVQDDRYVANPKNGSGHNRGISVDLTIIDLVTASELNMGTGFDNFSDTAHHTFTNLPYNILKNRSLLKSIMEEFGFKALETEWWHYALHNAKDYELLDISFKMLKKMNKHK